MRPIKFKDSNTVYTASRCGDLPAFFGVNVVGTSIIISCWRPNLFERIKFLVTGRIWLCIFGQTQPPVSLSLNCPFERKEVNNALEHFESKDRRS